MAQQGLSGAEAFVGEWPARAFPVSSSRDCTAAVSMTHAYTLVIPTKDRSYHLGRRLPVWDRLGFEEVIVVDSSKDPVHRKANEEACRRSGVRYIYADVNRSRARNLGAQAARGGWVFFEDDDLWGYATFHREVMDRYATKYDWLTARESQVLHIFNREFFLRLGGFRENLVLGEDEDLALRAKAQGTGGPTEGLFEGVGFEPNEIERGMDFTRRLSNYMEYSFTLWEYLDRVENPRLVAFSWFLSILRLLGSAAKGELRGVTYFLGAVGGLFFGRIAKSMRKIRPRGNINGKAGGR